MSYRKFNLNYFDIFLADLSDSGGIVICKDPKHRLGNNKTWAVIRTFANKEAPPEALGLFWDEVEADRYAECLT
jgi:hypothetical protein